MKNTLKKTFALVIAVAMLFTFTTIAFAAEKKVVIDMKDSFGDGWNGNYILISKAVDGVLEPVEKVTMTEGSHKTFELELTDNDSYVYEWITADFVDECSFVITIDGVTILYVARNYAPAENKVIYIDCEHNVVGKECVICGFECGIDFPHGYSSENGICACGAECTHSFIGTGICEFCGIGCSHGEYADIPCTAVFASGTPGVTDGEEASGLFDNNVYTKWCSDFDSDYCPYFIFRYDNAVKLISYTLTTADDTDLYPERNWIDWTVYGSNSADGEWTVVHDVKNAQLPAAYLTESEAFEVNADTAYMYYKVVVNNNGGEGDWGNSQQMAEFTPVVDVETYYGCTICGQEYKEPAEDETTEPDDSEDASEICSFCGKEHENLIEEIICLIMEFFHLIKEAFRISL